MTDHVCSICMEAVNVSPNPETWGFDWRTGWLHYRCVAETYAAMGRIIAGSPTAERYVRTIIEGGQPDRVQYLNHDEVHKEAMQNLSYRFWYSLLWPYYQIVKLVLKLRGRLRLVRRSDD